jgi:hypothetical protein
LRFQPLVECDNFFLLTVNDLLREFAHFLVLAVARAGTAVARAALMHV